jgi:Restriction endonuclease.
MTPRISPSLPGDAGAPAPSVPYFEPGDLRHALLDRLLSLPYAAFVAVVADLLEATGYSRVCPADRGHFRGRNGRDGAPCGWDLEAAVDAGGVHRRVLVQAKQYDPDRRLFQRGVDELRGVCLREGAAEALLVTTGRLSERLDPEVLAAAPLAPVRLVGGAELLDLLVARHVGTFSEAGDGARGRTWHLDAPYFDRKEREAGRGNGPRDCRVASEVTVRVSLEPVYRGPLPPLRAPAR